MMELAWNSESRPETLNSTACWIVGVAVLMDWSMMIVVPPYSGRPSVTAVTSLVVLWFCLVSTPPNFSVFTPSGIRIAGAVMLGVCVPSQKLGMTIDRKLCPPVSRSDLEGSSFSDWKKTLPSPFGPFVTWPMRRVTKGSAPAIVI
jgi:hypothetical protein